MRSLFFLGLFCVMAVDVLAQKYVGEKSLITFFSDAPIEDILATNTKVASIFNSQTSEIVFSIPIREFQFDKKLMQEHFNEKYMESEKYPKATFSGLLVNFNAAQTGVQQVQAKGKLTIHGVTQDLTVNGTVELDNKVILKSKFKVRLADYNIKIPQLMFQNIAEEVEISIDLTYKPQ